MRPINLKRNQYEQGLNRQLPHSASTNHIKFEPTFFPIKAKKTDITINMNQLSQQLKHYEWRQKTEFPIIKILEFYVKQSSQSKSVVEVDYQQCLIRLDELKDLPLFKLLYLIKESIIGFQRLFDRFGAFKITAKMIALNPSNRCKVWLNEDYSSNSMTTSFAVEIQFLNQIFSLFSERSNKLKNTSLFFNDLKKSYTFCQALSFIENYARENKITIPTICRISQNEKARVQSQLTVKAFDPNLTMGRAPKFFGNHLRSSLKFDNNSVFKDVMQRYSQKVTCTEENGQKNPEMKASGDTATGNSVQETQSKKKLENELVGSVFFDKKSKEITSKSFLPISNVEKKTFFTRKLSNPGQQINCYTPENGKKKWEVECHHVGLDWNDAAFLNEDQDDYRSTSILTDNVFNKNNWEKTLNGLFQGEDLKKSVHEGKQVRNPEISTRNLKLLQGLGKTLHQSCINGE